MILMLFDTTTTITSLTTIYVAFFLSAQTKHVLTHVQQQSHESIWFAGIPFGDHPLTLERYGEY